MLKRNIWNSLTEWKRRAHHPLVIKGLRQTGKTFIVKKFGEEFYENTVYVDFRASTKIHSAFEGDFDVDTMVMWIFRCGEAANPGKRKPSVRRLETATFVKRRIRLSGLA